MSERERARRRRFRRFMETYWSARHAWVMACESATALYDAEVQEFKQQCPPVLFKDYLIGSRGAPR